MEELIQQYKIYIQDWKNNQQHKLNKKIINHDKEIYFDFYDFKNSNHYFKFKELKNLNNENIFNKLEVDCLSCLFNNENEEPLELRNCYAHNIIYYEKRTKENQINFCIGLIILTNILIAFKEDVNKNLNYKKKNLTLILLVFPIFRLFINNICLF